MIGIGDQDKDETTIISLMTHQDCELLTGESNLQGCTEHKSLGGFRIFTLRCCMTCAFKASPFNFKETNTDPLLP